MAHRIEPDDDRLRFSQSIIDLKDPSVAVVVVVVVVVAVVVVVGYLERSRR